MNIFTLFRLESERSHGGMGNEALSPPPIANRLSSLSTPIRKCILCFTCLKLDYFCFQLLYSLSPSLCSFAPTLPWQGDDFCFLVSLTSRVTSEAGQTCTLQTRRQFAGIPRLVDFKRASDSAKTRFGLGPPMHDSRKREGAGVEAMWKKQQQEQLMM